MGSMTPALMTGLGSVSDIVGGVAPIFGAASDIVGSVRAITGGGDDDRRRALRAQQDMLLRQLAQKQQADAMNASERAALERERLAADASAADEKRRAALRRAVARQRASFGAQGTGSNDGSAEAVLLGLFEETDTDRAQRARLDDIRERFINQDLSAKNRINVLQRAQLAERQKLERMTG